MAREAGAEPAAERTVGVVGLGIVGLGGAALCLAQGRAKRDIGAVGAMLEEMTAPPGRGPTDFAPATPCRRSGRYSRSQPEIAVSAIRVVASSSIRAAHASAAGVGSLR